MSLMDAFARAISSLFTGAMLKITVLSLVITGAVLLAFIFIASSVFAIVFQGSWVLAVAGSLSAILFAWFLFPGIMPIIINFFDQRIINTIERHDYPTAKPITTAPFWPEFLHDAKFAVLVIGLNIAVLPLYLFVPLIPIIFYGLNGYLLGREFFIMVARRHLPLPEAQLLRQRHSGSITFSGIALAVMATIPVLNLIAPLWGMAVMTHLYHQLQHNPS
ncbi:MAG: EI24 domain-containing protein [Rickettsiales bacterium]|nr:EI24 domain-containing protein [Rickettsiales bacterium]